jgi:isopenicillin-N N-acyltransferase-like protein
MTMSHRYLTADGSAFERGLSIGQSWRDRIVTILRSNEEATLSQDGLTMHQWLPHAKTLLPVIRDYAPTALEEMQGMAQGSGLPFEDILLLSCAYEKYFNFHAPEHCTAFAVMNASSRNGDLICGQNNDECLHHWAAGGVDGVVHHRQDSGLEALIYTHPGIPAYMGMNSAGLCLLWMAIDNGERASGLPTNILIRETLLRTTLESAVEYIKKTPKTVPNSYILAHPEDGICSIECSATYFSAVKGNNKVYHANHILDKNMALKDQKIDDPASSTLSRFKAMRSLIDKHDGSVDIPLAKAILSDHTRYPESICNHPRPNAIYSKTLASMIFHPVSGSMEIAFGNGCEVPYKSYSFARHS